MKIFLVNQEHAEFGGPGGAERSVQGLAEQLVQSGHEVTFLAMSRRAYHRDMLESGIHSVTSINGVKTVMLGKVSKLPSHADLIRPIVLYENPDVVHTNVFHYCPQLWEQLSALKIPVVHTLREYKLICGFNLFAGGVDCESPCRECFEGSAYRRHVSNFVDGVVGISSFTLDRHLNNGFFANAKVREVIPNSYVAPDEPTQRSRRGSGDPLRVGYLGRIHATKGVGVLLEAFGELDDEGYQLVLAGDHQDEEVWERVLQLEHDGQAKYLGFVQPEVLLSEVDVLVVPSLWHEPFGRVAIEALAHAVPVIASRRGGLIEIVSDGVNGWLFDPNSPGALAGLLRQIRAMDGDAFQEIRLAAAASHAKYRPEVVAKHYESVYQRVLERRGEGGSRTITRLRALYQHDAERQRALATMQTRKAPRDRRSLRILVVTGEFPKLSETFVLSHVVGLLQLGHDVRVLSLRPSIPAHVPQQFLAHDVAARTFDLTLTDTERRILRDVVRKRPAEIKHQGSQVGRLMQRFREATKFKEHAGDVDIVHCHFGHRARPILDLRDCGAFDAPVVCSFHGIDVSAHIKQKGNGLYDDVKYRLAKSLPISDFFRKRLIGLGFDPKDVLVHRVGIDCDLFKPSEAMRGPRDSLRILSVGRLVAKKGFEHGISAVARALEMRSDLLVEYSIVGEGDEAEHLQELIADNGLQERVKLLGARGHGEVCELMANSHALMAPSVTGPDGDMEGIPTVTMEAMATGLPVVATTHSGIPEAVMHGATGLLAPEAGVDALAQHMIWLFDNPQEARFMGRRGRAHVLREFNIAVQNERVVDLYRRIIAGQDV